jgi:hypothetical protein
MAAGAAVVSRDDAADRGAIRRRRIEGNPLAVQGKRAIDALERCARLNRRRQIAVAVRDDGAQTFGRKKDVDCARRRSPSKLRPRAADEHGHLFARCPPDDGRNRVGGRRFHDNLRNDSIDGVGRQPGARCVRTDKRGRGFMQHRDRHSSRH